MRRTDLALALLGVFMVFGASCTKARVERKTIDGVVHVINPADPINGVVQLQVEKTLEINPYEYEEVSLRYFRFYRGAAGEGVVLYNPNQAEAQKFDSAGRWLGPLPLLRQGQGPGEFPGFFRLFIVGDAILAAGNAKLAKFDVSGRLVGETKISDISAQVIDEQSYIAEEKIPDEKGLFTRIVYVELSDREDVETSRTTLFEAAGVGMIRLKTGGAFGSSWVTHDVLWDLYRPKGPIYLALNKEYKIFLMDLRGELLRVIEMPHKSIKLDREGRRSLLAKFKGGNLKAIEDAFPDELVALEGLKSLPHGWLAAFRVMGVEKLEVDIFDPEGKYVYRIETPPGIPLSDAVFHETGFSVIEEKDDYRVYRDYRITNLPEIFE